MRGAAILTILSVLLAFSAIYIEFSRIEHKSPKTTEIRKFNVETKASGKTEIAETIK